MLFFMKSFRHRNIIQATEVFKQNNLVSVVLPKYRVLTDLLQFTTKAAHRFFKMNIDIAHGVQFLHDEGIAHMDIKLDNILYDNSYVVRIIDFDLVIWVKNEEQLIEDNMQGSVFWMAPGMSIFDSLFLFSHSNSQSEIQDELPYSPIQADRFSCGFVFEQMGRIAENRVPPLRWIKLLLHLFNFPPVEHGHYKY